MPSTVGIIVNPHAGKDIRRLVSAAGQTSDAVKVGIMRRAVAGAIEQGAQRILMSTDTHHLAEQATEGLNDCDGIVEYIEGPQTGSHLDTTAAAAEMWKQRAGAVIALGGDGTCRDVALGWPQVPLIAVSTGTNNVFPDSLDGTSAGVAAALVASGDVALDDVGAAAKRVTLTIDDPVLGVSHDDALVEAALVDTTFVGARAVSDPSTIRWVIAAIANPASTGVASVAGRTHPVGRNDDGGVLIRMGAGGRQVRVPLSPGVFSTLSVESVQPLALTEPVTLRGGGVLAYDGERTTPITADTTVVASVERSGPIMIDVERTITQAAIDRRFDVTSRKDTHGD